MTMNLEFDNKILLNKLNKYFLNNTRMMVKTHNQLFAITEADLFYEINIYDENFPSFVLCDDNSIIESMIVKQLSGKRIINLSYGFCHFFAWNDKNEIFCWGNNSCGQLGIGKRDDEIASLDFINALRHKKENFLERSFGKHQNEPELNVLLSNLNIIDIRCGFWHSLALAKSGEVYAWGLISTGESIEEMSQTTPIKIDGFDSEKVVMISCGYKHFLALTESGRVFSWGENSYGQLGVENEINREKPKMIEIENFSFEKISCGQRHSLLLSRDGVIFAFGDNRCGQIGSGNKETQNKPIKLTGSDRFINIASSFMEDISVAQSINNNFYVWGNCGEETHLTPLLTSCKSFDEVFSNYSCIQYKLRDNDLLYRDGYFENEFTVIGKELEHGTFGKVFKIKDKNGNYFAIRKVKPIDGYEKDFLREFIKLSIANQIGSEFFVKHYDSWFEKNKNNTGFILYIKMELCDKTLKDVMNEIHTEFLKKEDKILSLVGYYLASEIFIDILRSVLYLHQHKVTHRNLNPSNILFKKEPNCDIYVKIIDFGLSKLHEFTEQSHTQDREMYRYVAPEVMNSNTNGVKADIYSLGIILENLFKIDPTKDYKKNSLKDCMLSKKHNQALEIFSRMTNRVPSKRPNCEVILEAEQSWALNENEFDIEHELNFVFESVFKGKNFLIHSILESKFIAIKEKIMAKRESSALETLNNYEHNPNLVQKFLAKLKNFNIISFELRTKLIECLVDLMQKYSNLFEILQSLEQNAISCLHSLIENNSIECSNSKILENNETDTINPEQLEKVIEVTLIAMELYPDQKELQKSALIILYGEQILENLSSERFKCTKLVMDSLVNFNERDMNLMASVICATHLMKLSIKEREVLCTNDSYIKNLLNIINSSSCFDLIENTLSALVNLIVDSPKNCSIFLELKGLDISLSLLEKFVGCNDVEFRVLGLLYNIAEFPQFKNEFLESKFISKLRNLLHSLRNNVSFLAAGIFAQLLHDGQNTVSDSKIILDELMNVILNWKTLDKDCVSFVSFSNFQPLLNSFASPAVQLWAFWTLYHFCSENPEKYCALLLKEIGIDSLKALQQNSKTNQCEPLITLCQKILEIFEK